MRHCESMGRAAHLINLDPAADNFEYTHSKDIKELITVDEVMEELSLGPNGGLVYCLETLLDNIDWLEDDLGEFNDEFLIVDCPGQIELYTHYDIISEFIKVFEKNSYRVAVCYLLESQFFQDVTKFFAGVLNATSAMMKLAVPHLNILSKMDLIQDVDDEELEDISDELHPLHRYFYPDPALLTERLSASTPAKFARLNEALVQLIDEFDMVNFIPLNIRKEASLENIMMHIDNATQYSEGLEPKEPKEFGDGEDDYEQEYDCGFESQD